MLKHNIDIATLWNIKGWVFDKHNPANKLEVIIKVNNNTIDSTKANIFREGLLKNKLHPDGHAGFFTYIGDKVSIEDGDTLSIVVNEEVLLEKRIDNTITSKSNQANTILIVGLGKSGTSKLTYVVKSGMPNNTKVHFEPNGRHGLADINLHKKLVQQSQPMVNKSLFINNQTVPFGQLSHLYDKKVWILRDPRDRVVSLMLYRWFKGHKPNQEKFNIALDLIKSKEANPKSITIKEIWDVVYAPGMYEKRLRAEYKKLDHILSNLDSSWYILRYEDMIDGNIFGLNDYLGFNTSLDEEVPNKLSRVVRSKGYGNWKHWFTETDISFYKTIFGDFIDKYFENINDWSLNEHQIINPQKGSEYMSKLFYGN